MLVSAQRNTIAAAISAGVQARLSSERSMAACLRACGHGRVQSVSTKPGATAFARASGASLLDIARRADHGKAVGAQPLYRRGAARIVRQVIEGDLGAAPGEQLDRGQPDARCCARYQCGFAFEVAHARPGK